MICLIFPPDDCPNVRDTDHTCQLRDRLLIVRVASNGYLLDPKLLVRIGAQIPDEFSQIVQAQAEYPFQVKVSCFGVEVLADLLCSGVAVGVGVVGFVKGEAFVYPCGTGDLALPFPIGVEKKGGTRKQPPKGKNNHYGTPSKLHTYTTQGGSRYGHFNLT